MFPPDYIDETELQISLIKDLKNFKCAFPFWECWRNYPILWRVNLRKRSLSVHKSFLDIGESIILEFMILVGGKNSVDDS